MELLKIDAWLEREFYEQRAGDVGMIVGAGVEAAEKSCVVFAASSGQES
ncbi:MAG: hypothetical protein AAGD25_13690 [Cyanobacteria bacterium P01_F01_bin.150]